MNQGVISWTRAGTATGFSVTLDGGGIALSTGVKIDLVMPFSMMIQSVTMLADQSGSVVVDVWQDTYANYPPTVADTITASAPPTITSAISSRDTTLTGWITRLEVGNTLRFNINSVSAIQRVSLNFLGVRT